MLRFGSLSKSQQLILDDT